MTPADILPWAALASVLAVFFGMLALAWRALSIAHDLAKLALQGGMPAQQIPKIPSVTSMLPTPHPTPTPSPAPAPASDVAVDQGLVDFIKKAEGFQSKAYWDYKQYSIGYGTKANSASEVIDQAEGERRLRAEIAVADGAVTGFVSGLPKGVHQALIDLTYNAGSGWEQAALGKQVKAAITSGDWSHVKADILQYNHAGGQVNAGLTARREAEVSWFDNPL